MFIALPSGSVCRFIFYKEVVILLIQVYVQLSDPALLNGLSLWTCCYLIQNIWHFPVNKNMRSRLDLAASQPIDPMVPKWWNHMASKLNGKRRNYPYQRNRHSYTVVWTNCTSWGKNKTYNFITHNNTDSEVPSQHALWKIHRRLLPCANRFVLRWQSCRLTTSFLNFAEQNMNIVKNPNGST